MKKIFYILLTINVFACNSPNQKIEKAIEQQLKCYPESRLQDIYKNFYQDCFGTGHAISDTSFVLQYIEDELNNTTPSSKIPMVENLGWRNNFVRINIDLVRNGKINIDTLAKAFILSSQCLNHSDTANWKNEWQTIVKIIEKKHLPVKDFEKDKMLIDSLLQINPNRAMHHSPQFNQFYYPHYRVVKKNIFEKMFEF